MGFTMQHVTTKAQKTFIQIFMLQREFNTKSFLFPLVLGSALIFDHAGRGAGNKAIQCLVQQLSPLPLNFDTYYCIRASFGPGSGSLHS
jgi:hypothetical protein